MTGKLDSLLARAPLVAPLMAQRLAADFGAFARAAFHVIDPAKLQWSWHHDLICEHLQLAAQRKIKRLSVSLPPRSLKSKLVSVLWPAWIVINSPSEQFIIASHSASLSSEMNVLRRSLLESRWFRRLWPDVAVFRSDQNRQDDQATHQGARFLSCGMSNVVGRGCNFLIVDDGLTPEQAFSELERTNAIRAYNGGLRSRLNSPTEDVIVLVQQKLHRLDIVGTIEDSAEARDWTFLSLPIIERQDRKIVFPVSGRVIERHKGDLLHPQRWSKRWIESEAEAIGPFLWNAQYLQSPSDPSEAILRRDFWRFWSYAGADKSEGVFTLPDKFDQVVIAGDLTFTSNNHSDRVCLVVLGKAGRFIYALQLEWARMDFEQTCAALSRLCREYPNYNKVVIEKAANASALLSSLLHEIPGITLVVPQGSKQSRYHAIVPVASRGQIVLPHPSVYRRSAELVNELEHAGCGGRFDDSADALCLGVSTLVDMASYGPPIVMTSPSLSMRYRDFMVRTMRAGNPFRSNGGFPDQRPVLPSDAPHLSPAAAAAAAKIVAGGSGTVEAMETMMWASIGDLTGEASQEETNDAPH